MSSKQAHEILLASSILIEADTVEFIKLKIQEEIIGEGYRELFTYLHDFVNEYSKIPDVATVKSKFGFKFVKVVETSKYYHNELFEHYKRRQIYTMCKTANDMSNAGEYDEAMKIILERVAALNLLDNSENVLNFTEKGLEEFESYQLKQKLEGGKDFIKLGWPYFDDQNGGITGGDVLSLIGRPGTGKTYLALRIAMQAWANQGKVPLFVSMEVNPQSLMHRIVAMHTNTYVSDVKKATISTKKKTEVITKLEGLEGMPAFWIVDGNLSSSVGDIEKWVTELKPDLVVVDGAYLIDSDDSYRQAFHQRIKDSCEAMKKRVAAVKNIPVVLSYQFNRDATKLKPEEQASLEHIGGSDAIGQISSIVLGLFDDDNQANYLNKKTVSILKGREGELGKFLIKWLFNAYPNMCFDQLDTEANAEDNLKYK